MIEPEKIALNLTQRKGVGPLGASGLSTQILFWRLREANNCHAK